MSTVFLSDRQTLSSCSERGALYVARTQCQPFVFLKVSKGFNTACPSQEVRIIETSNTPSIAVFNYFQISNKWYFFLPKRTIKNRPYKAFSAVKMSAHFILSSAL